MTLSSLISSLLPQRVKESIKARAEMRYWNRRKQAEQSLSNEHYERFYTSLFGLSRTSYTGKAILDVGCGPRGSLEWADNARERIGLDPLVDSYRILGIDTHAMQYVRAHAEAIPFENGRFDVVASFNSLDHVEDPVEAARELVRVLAPGGTLLLIVEVEHEATLTEPHRINANCTSQLFQDLDLSWQARFRMDDDKGLYEQIANDDRVVGDRLDEAHILAARMHKPVSG